MILEWKVWNIHKDWQPMKATTLEEAARELQNHMPYSEEAKIRIDGKEILNYTFVPKSNFGPF
jgi:hypothetical protein